MKFSAHAKHLSRSHIAATFANLQFAGDTILNASLFLDFIPLYCPATLFSCILLIPESLLFRVNELSGLASNLPFSCLETAPNDAGRWFMTVLLVVAMFAIFLTIDYLRSRKRVTAPAISVEEKVPAALGLQPSYVSGFDVPGNLRYHPGHTWALQESPTLVRVGMDDFAACLIGKCDSITLPKRGQWIRQGQKLATIFRDGQKAELVSPIEGEVTNINEDISKDPGTPLREPYKGGWLVSVMSPDAQTNFRNLLGGDVARKWMAEAASRLRAKLPAFAGAVAQDGGIAVRDLTAEVPGQDWQQLTHEFFLI
jgi:glycine cleavage system H protein